MNPKKIIEREMRKRTQNSYFYKTFEKPKAELQGETVEQFLARGGAIKRIVTRKTPLKDANGHFIKGSTVEIQERKIV